MINFSYTKKEIQAHSGVMFRGKNYRCFYVTFPTLYNHAVPGTEIMQLYDFRPKDKIRGSAIILQGLGARNVEFLLWMGTRLASAGINALLPVLPGNFTRVEDGRVYGTPYLWPDYDIMYNAYEHSVVDIMSTIDYVEQQDRWKDNNCMVGYCLGGMLATIVSALDDRINQKIFMTTGGHIPQLMFESISTGFVRRMVREGQVHDKILNNKEALYEIYDTQMPRVREMSLEEIITSQDIHPLFKVDPLSYAHLLDKSKISVIDALFDRTLSMTSRKAFYKEMKGAKRYILPISHVSWLPFEFLLARYILHKVNVYDRKAARRILTKEVIQDTIQDDEQHK